MFSSPTAISTKSVRGLRSQYICPQCLLKTSRRRISSSVRLREALRDPASHSQSHRKQHTGLKHNKASEKTIFSLIQPTGIPHLGNYLGALRQWKSFQDECSSSHQHHNSPKHKLIFGIADLHALTLRQDRSTRKNNVKQTLASLLAIGLNTQHSKLMVQSHLPEHSELMWILSNVASTGYLSRMTQWKSKINVSHDTSIDTLDEKSREMLKLSLFSYPVLQAADILLYQSDLVPVGEDQIQHVEFARYLARAFNAEYARDYDHPVLKEPEAFISPAKRIMSLQDPTKKKSKSDTTKDATILITDPPEEVVRKIKRAKTDSIDGPLTYDPVARPGIANLFDILRHTTTSNNSNEEDEQPEVFAAQYAHTTKADLKSLVADAIINELSGVKTRFDALMRPDNNEIEDALRQTYHVCSELSARTMRDVKRAVGLYELPSSMKLKNREEGDKAEKVEEQVEKEQRQEQRDGVEEPDVLPQQREGVDIPLAS